MQTPTLNFDVISNILNIRMNQKRKDRIEAHKKIYGPVVKNLQEIFYTLDNYSMDCFDEFWEEAIFEEIQEEE
jgi:hypothetical protein